MPPPTTPSPPSAVRSLLAKFENKGPVSTPNHNSSNHTSSSSLHGTETSSGSLSHGSSTPPLRPTVRSSFIAVEPTEPRPAPPAMVADEATTDTTTARRRRESFSVDEQSNPAPLAELKQTISQEMERRRSNAGIETVPEVAVFTPAIGRENTQLTSAPKEEEKTSDQPTDGPSTQQPKDDVTSASPNTDQSAGGEAVHAPDTDTPQRGVPESDLPVTPLHKDVDDLPASHQGVPAITDAQGASDSGESEVKKKGSGKLAGKPGATPHPSGKTKLLPTQKGQPEKATKDKPSTARPAGSRKPTSTSMTSASKAGSSKDATAKKPVPVRARSLSHKPAHQQQTQPSSTHAPTTTSGAANKARTKSLTRTTKPTSSAAASSGATTNTGNLAGPKAKKGPDNAQAGSDHLSTGTKAKAGQAAAGHHASSGAASTRPRTSALAPTASSAAKTSSTTTTGGASSLSRTPSSASARGHVRGQQSISSRAAAKPAHSKAAGTGGSSDARAESGPRAGAPAPKTAHTPTAAHGPRTSNVGTKSGTEGFLARMMRPTASSASKTHDKPPPAGRPSAARTRSAVDKAGRANDGKDKDKDKRARGSKESSVEPKLEPGPESKPETEPEKDAGPTEKETPGTNESAEPQTVEPSSVNGGGEKDEGAMGQDEAAGQDPADAGQAEGSNPVEATAAAA